MHYSTAGTNTTALSDIFILVNNESGMYGFLVLFGIWIVLFALFKRWRTSVAFSISSFLSSIIGILFYKSGWIPDFVVVLLVFMTMIGVFALYFEKGSYSY